MGYIESNLMPGEAIIYSTKQTKWIFLPGVIILILFPTFFFVLGTWLNVGPIFGYLFVALGLYIIFRIYIKYISCKFTITNRRVVSKTGFIKRNIYELLLNKIEGVAIHQNVLSRILNIGSIYISGTGGSRTIAFSIDRPLEFKQLLQQQLDMLYSYTN